MPPLTVDRPAATARRRGYGEGSVYFNAVNNHWTGAVSLGYAPDGKRRVRRKVTGRTKTEVRDKLKALHRELDAGIRASSSYTMALCIEDWLSPGLADRSPSTVANYRHLASHAVAKIGAVKLQDLTARHVQTALTELSGSLSTRSLRLVHQIIERAIRHAQAADLVGRNVASLIAAPEGKKGRPSRSLTLDQAAAVLTAAEDSPLHAYVVCPCWPACGPRNCGHSAGPKWTWTQGPWRCTAASARPGTSRRRRAGGC